MSPHDTQPTQVLPEWGYAEPPKKRRWPWIIVFGLVLAGGVAAWFLAEAAARDIVENTIRDGITDQLDLPADQQIDVSVAGVVIPQLIVGTVDEIDISSEDVALDGISGDVRVNAQELRIREPHTMGSANATVSMDEEQLRTLLATVDGFPSESLGLDDPNVTMSTELSFLGLEIPVSAALTPSAVDGELVLSPASFTVADAEVSADGLRDQFGVVGEVVLKDWPVCIASYLPAGVALTSAAVDGDLLTADFDIDPRLLADTALQQNGTCE
ncbi:DUF2993 domain-containing protein [Microbacterium sp. C7(2022)]|uniref:LmeA family phospholipid-binding protein n=1 Tax=Microbacterium sp. C7(2022) TaxID=2992759 RepID=UPI00237C49CB|nr:DUF2993 domain-containing protein [Microbacterium sp. C7(2022)]MDE0547238.1 LmeA family phospholipid-binding protein [Microbacterium sp. C7(2022)]